jgi:hypothetical protein
MVATTDHAICYGTHFISTATLRETCYSIFHTFLARSAVTNANNTSVWTVLQRFLGYYHDAFLHRVFRDKGLDKTHLPDITTAGGVLDLFTLLVTLELSIALHPETYQKGVSSAHWARAQRAKIQSRRLLKWFDVHFALLKGGEPTDVYSSLLVQISMSFVSYLAYGREQGLGSTHYDMDRLLYEVQEVLAARPETEPMMKDRGKYILDTFEHDKAFVVKAKSNPQWSTKDLPNIPVAASPPPHVKPRLNLSDFLGGETPPPFPYPTGGERGGVTAKKRRKV